MMQNFMVKEKAAIYRFPTQLTHQRLLRITRVIGAIQSLPAKIHLLTIE